MSVFIEGPLVQVYMGVLLTIASYFFTLSLGNHYEMWRFSLASEIFNGPMVSVLVPARNEEENIERCLKTLRKQVYKNFEILVLNDNSSDNTMEILERIAAEDSRVRVFNGRRLPPDWYGKPYALHQLSLKAQGEIFIFTDADTVHSPTSISWAVTNLMGLKADLISGYVGQVFKTFGEIVTIPLMFFLTGFAIPLFLNRFVKVPWFAAAIGQFIAVKRDVFEAIGGCESFKKKTSEDVYMCRFIKSKGYTTRFLNIADHVKCHMYDGYQNAVEGIGKNIFDFFGKRTLLLFSIMLVVFLFLFFPFPFFIITLFYFGPMTLPAAVVYCLYTLTWVFMFLGQRLNWWYGFLWPIMFLNLIYMGLWSWFRTISGKGFIWKDRVVN